MADQKLQDEIDELAGYPSERPSQNVIVIEQPKRSILPIREEVKKSVWAKIISIVLAIGAICEVIHEILR